MVEHHGINNNIADLSFSYHDKVDPSEDARYFLSVQKGSPDGRKNCKKVREICTRQLFTLPWIIYHFECLVP